LTGEQLQPKRKEKRKKEEEEPVIIEPKLSLRKGV
jgi:hypothetical protein